MQKRLQHLPTLNSSRSTTARTSGFTFVELMLGLLVTSLVMGALAAVMSAVAQGWQQSSSASSSTNVTAQVTLRLQQKLRAAHLIGAIRPGSMTGATVQAAALLWKADANYDWNVQFSEIALLEYHPSTDATDPNTLRLYQVNWPAGWTLGQQQAADSTLSSNDEIYQDSEIDTFRGLQYVSYTVLARNVTACAFHKNDSYTTNRPSLDYEIAISQNGATTTKLGTVSLRSPSTVPVSQR